jgi:hypothetical protein
MSELDFSSGCLISQLNTKKSQREKNYSNSVSRIINSSRTKSKFIKEKSFFRFITKTQCEILKDEQKILSEKILMFYKKADIKYITVDTNNEIESKLNQTPSRNTSINAESKYYII